MASEKPFFSMTVSEQEDELHFRSVSDFEFFNKKGFPLVQLHLTLMVGFYIVNIDLMSDFSFSSFFDFHPLVVK